MPSRPSSPGARSPKRPRTPTTSTFTVRGVSDTVTVENGLYDALIRTNPEAVLSYIDDDDGEIITVGSSHELHSRVLEILSYPPPPPPVIFEVADGTGLRHWQQLVEHIKDLQTPEPAPASAQPARTPPPQPQYDSEEEALYEVPKPVQPQTTSSDSSSYATVKEEETDREAEPHMIPEVFAGTSENDGAAFVASFEAEINKILDDFMSQAGTPRAMSPRPMDEATEEPLVELEGQTSTAREAVVSEEERPLPTEPVPTASEVFTDVFKAILFSINEVKTQAARAFPQHFGPTATADFNNAINNVVEKVTEQLQSIAAQNHPAKVRTFAENVGHMAVENAGKLREGVRDVGADAGVEVKKVAEELKKATDEVRKTAQLVGQEFGKTGRVIGNFAGGAGKEVGKAFGSGASLVGGLAGGLAGGFVQTIGSMRQHALAQATTAANHNAAPEEVASISDEEVTQAMRNDEAAKFITDMMNGLPYSIGSTSAVPMAIPRTVDPELTPLRGKPSPDTPRFTAEVPAAAAEDKGPTPPPKEPVSESESSRAASPVAARDPFAALGRDSSARFNTRNVTPSDPFEDSARYITEQGYPRRAFVSRDYTEPHHGFRRHQDFNLEPYFRRFETQPGRAERAQKNFTRNFEPRPSSSKRSSICPFPELDTLVDDTRREFEAPRPLDKGKGRAIAVEVESDMGSATVEETGVISDSQTSDSEDEGGFRKPVSRVKSGYSYIDPGFTAAERDAWRARWRPSARRERSGNMHARKGPRGSFHRISYGPNGEAIRHRRTSRYQYPDSGDERSTRGSERGSSHTGSHRQEPVEQPNFGDRFYTPQNRVSSPPYAVPFTHGFPHNFPPPPTTMYPPPPQPYIESDNESRRSWARSELPAFEGQMRDLYELPAPPSHLPQSSNDDNVRRRHSSYFPRSTYADLSDSDSESDAEPVRLSGGVALPTERSDEKEVAPAVPAHGNPLGMSRSGNSSVSSFLTSLESTDEVARATPGVSFPGLRRVRTTTDAFGSESERPWLAPWQKPSTSGSSSTTDTEAMRRFPSLSELHGGLRAPPPPPAPPAPYYNLSTPSSLTSSLRNAFPPLQPTPMYQPAPILVNPFAPPPPPPPAPPILPAANSSGRPRSIVTKNPFADGNTIEGRSSVNSADVTNTFDALFANSAHEVMPQAPAQNTGIRRASTISSMSRSSSGSASTVRRVGFASGNPARRQTFFTPPGGFPIEDSDDDETSTPILAAPRQQEDAATREVERMKLTEKVKATVKKDESEMKRKVDECVETLVEFGFENENMGKDRLRVFAEMAKGDVEAAIEEIEEERNAWEKYT